MFVAIASHHHVPEPEQAFCAFMDDVAASVAEAIRLVSLSAANERADTKTK